MLVPIRFGYLTIFWISISSESIDGARIFVRGQNRSRSMWFRMIVTYSPPTLTGVAISERFLPTLAIF